MCLFMKENVFSSIYSYKRTSFILIFEIIQERILKRSFSHYKFSGLRLVFFFHLNPIKLKIE
jgi:cytochrome c oxidase subunit IV